MPHMYSYTFIYTSLYAQTHVDTEEQMTKHQASKVGIVLDTNPTIIYNFTFYLFNFLASVIQSSVIVTSKGHVSPWKQNKNRQVTLWITSTVSQWMPGVHTSKKTEFNCTSWRSDFSVYRSRARISIIFMTTDPTGMGKVKKRHFWLFTWTLSCLAVY